MNCTFYTNVYEKPPTVRNRNIITVQGPDYGERVPMDFISPRDQEEFEWKKSGERTRM